MVDPDTLAPNQSRSSEFDPQAIGVYVAVHGHFYQPPRENPYLDAIERQPGAEPYHDWNERIHYECYRPNAFARILSDRGEILGIVNNYEYLSFNVGPTLMNWLERYDREVYERILDGDRQSAKRLGKGNAIAQVYNHMIMPLANERDKLTQIRWGIADFRSRFHRDPEGMWLAETAVDYPTLETLVTEGIRFIILAPSQAERCRPIPNVDNPQPEWHEVGGSQIDPTRPYRCYLQPAIASTPDSLSTHHFSRRPLSKPQIPHPNAPYIDIFFYDGPISRDMGFSDVLSSAHHFAGRLGQAVRGDHRPAQLIAVATDGETFGHHKGGTEKCLAYSFTEEFPRRNWTVTNFAHYLSISSPTWEVELKPVTAWSCAHGVDRWQDDCGCAGGGGWHQKWRKPLRNALNWLRDRLILIYEEVGNKFFIDPWAARDEYIQVMRDRSEENVNRFFSKQTTHKLDATERVDALRLLEMQRHALLMFTSCGWFFEEISRPEGVQILRYAARAIELAVEVAGIHLETEFIQHLDLAPSNIDLFKTGAEVYRQQVMTNQISLDQVAAHYAISSLFTTFTPEAQVYCYKAHQIDYLMQRIGALSLAVGQVRLTSEITQENQVFVFAVFHLGGWDFHCCIQPFGGRRSYTMLKERLFTVLEEASAAGAILEMVRLFGDQSFSLKNLFAEERHRIMRLLSQETLTRLDQLYSQVYRDNYGVLMAFHRDELEVPVELQVAAEVALGHRCLTVMKSLEVEQGEGKLGLATVAELEAIATEASQLRIKLQILEVKQILERILWRSLAQLLEQENTATVNAEIDRIDRLINLGNRLSPGLSLDRLQDLYFQSLHSQIVPLCLGWLQRLTAPTLTAEQAEKATNTTTLVCIEPTTRWELSQIEKLLELGQKLSLDVHRWLQLLRNEN
ncbi:glycoside hydrolase [Oscillatoriales cyanobacterium USR001]|nr:glycoside hydrolase [Oscillatoriales cyanobacterium USR001]